MSFSLAVLFLHPPWLCTEPAGPGVDTTDAPACLTLGLTDAALDRWCLHSPCTPVSTYTEWEFIVPPQLTSAALGSLHCI
jgi:hypothetical protein